MRRVLWLMPPKPAFRQDGGHSPGARGVTVGTWLGFGFGGVRSGGGGSALSVRQFVGVVRDVGEVRFGG
jgi:hypothetical protein